MGCDPSGTEDKITNEPEMRSDTARKQTGTKQTSPAGRCSKWKPGAGARAERGGDLCPAAEVVKLVQIFELVSDTLRQPDKC